MGWCGSFVCILVYGFTFAYDLVASCLVCHTPKPPNTPHTHTHKQAVVQSLSRELEIPSLHEDMRLIRAPPPEARPRPIYMSTALQVVQEGTD